MSFFRHGEIYHFDEGAIPADHALAHRNDEFPDGYSLAGCAPAEPAAASPSGAHLARKGFRGTMQFQRTVRSALTVCLTPGDNPKQNWPLFKAAFNIPKGTKEKVILETDNFRRVSLALARAALVSGDFEPIIQRAQEGDLIFADPPYVTSHSNNGFLKYNEKLFSWDDQVRLRDCLFEAKEKGVHVLATNADSPPIRKLYDEVFSVQSVTRYSVIAAGPDKRGITSELIITSW
jgi:hypothetical protein